MTGRILIVGGGPAGLACALNLAKHGLYSIVIDKKSFPIDKACGEGIMPHGVEELRNLDVLQSFNSSNSHHFFGICFNYKDKQAEGKFINGYGLGIRRSMLSQILFAKASQSEFIKIIPNCALEKIQQEGEHVIVNTSSGDFQGEYLVGADGIRSKTRKLAQISHTLMPLRRYGIRQHFELKPWSNKVEVYWQKQLAAYVTPIGAKKIGLAFLWHKKLKPKVEINYFLNFFPELQRKINLSKSISSVSSTGPFFYKVLRPYCNRIMLIGDASGYLDPITGEGISISFLQARLLAESLAHKESIPGYYTRYKALATPYRLTTLGLMKLSQSNLALSAMVNVLKRFPIIFEKSIAISSQFNS